MRLLFGHQSVGSNLLQGLADLPASEKPQLAIRGLADPGARDQPAIVHFEVGTNGLPDGKLQDFSGRLESLRGAAFNVAMVKFCYVDLNDERESLPLFERYLAWVEQLKLRHPEVRIAHCTIPLRCASPGLLASARRLLKQPDPELTRNLARQAYNERLRRFCRGTGRLFDLAFEESRSSYGFSLRYQQDGRSIPAMRPAFSDDGGHLNAQGRAVVGRAFAAFLSRMMLDARA